MCSTCCFWGMLLMCMYGMHIWQQSPDTNPSKITTSSVEQDNTATQNNCSKNSTSKPCKGTNNRRIQAPNATFAHITVTVST